MDFSQPSYFLTILPFMAAGIALINALWAWKNRELPGIRSLSTLLISVAIWSMFESIHYHETDLTMKITWSKVQYIGIATTPVMFQIFAARYSRQDRWLTKPVMGLLWIIPLTTLVMVATNELHLLHWRSFNFEQGQNALTYNYGPWFWIYAVVSYIYLIGGTYLLLRFGFRLQKGERSRLTLIILAAIIPWIANVAHILGLMPVRGLDLTPVSMILSTLLLSISITYFRFVDITPIARHKLVDTLEDGLIVIDLSGIIVDINPAALAIIRQTKKKTISKPASIVLKDWPQLLGQLSQAPVETIEVTQTKGSQSQWFTTRISPLNNHRGALIGHLCIIRNITSEIQARSEIRDFSDRLTVLHEIGIQLSQTDEFNELFRKAVLAGHQRLGFERIGIWLVDPLNPDYLLGTYGIDERGQIRDERTQYHHKSKHIEYVQAREEKKRIYTLLDTPLYDHQAKQVGIGEMIISGFWDGEKILGYVSIDNLISGKKINERQRTLLILYSQTIGNLLIRRSTDQSLRSFTEKLAILHEISYELSQINTLARMTRQAVLFGRDRLGFDRLRIWFVDRDNTEVIRGSYGIDDGGNIADERHLSMARESSLIHVLESSPLQRVFHQKKAIIRNHEGENLGSGEIVVSALWDGNVITGFIQADNLISGTSFVPNQLEILGLYAQIIGSLSTQIVNTDKIHKAAREQLFLGEISQIAIQQTDFQELLQELVDALGQLFQADGCYITLWDEGRKKPIPGAGYGPYKNIFTRDKSVLPMEGERTKTESVLTSGEILVIEDSYDSEFISKRIARKFPSRSSLVLPLIANEVKLGAAIVSYNRIYHFSQDEIDLSKKASQQIALAMMKTRLFEEAQVRAREAETLRHASAAVVETLNQDEAIERVLEQLNLVVPYDSASVQLLDGEELTIVGERGFQSGISFKGERFKVEKDIPHALVMEKLEPVIIEDAPKAYAAFRDPSYEHIHGWMGIPLKAHEQLIGMLALHSTQPGKFNENHRRLATAFGDQVAIALENTRLFKEIQWLAIHDSLTKLINRHHFMTLAKREFERARRHNKPLSAIMLDIDHFKEVNDTHGHLIGDRVLEYVAKVCVSGLRSYDIIGRYGGEEFVILLPETTAQMMLFDQPNLTSIMEPAKVVAERIRRAFEGECFRTEKGDLYIRVSLGIAELTEGMERIEQLIYRADQALLHAKRTGRNRVSIWPLSEDVGQVSIDEGA